MLLVINDLRFRKSRYSKCSDSEKEKVKRDFLVGVDDFGDGFGNRSLRRGSPHQYITTFFLILRINILLRFR